MATIERITEYIDLDVDREVWSCNRCHRDLGPASDTYKRGLLVYDRDPREIHRPLLDPERYEFTFSPDPELCRILEFYCPGCGAQVETEYLVPGHPITRDIELDIDWLRRRAAREEEENREAN